MHRDLDTPADLTARLDAERRGLPLVVFRDPAGAQHIVTLGTGSNERTVGRADECDVRIEGDAEVSRLHALLVRRAACGRSRTPACLATGRSSTASACTATASSATGTPSAPD